MENRKKSLIASLALSLGTGGVSAWLTRDSMDIYGSLRQPPLSPPGWVFPVVWTILFILMGVAAWMVWEEGAPERDTPLRLYAIQLFFNFVWPLIFFNARLYGLALVWIVLLWMLILLTAIRFWQVRPAAGWFMAPYLLWVTFAVYLNAGVWWLNP